MIHDGEYGPEASSESRRLLMAFWRLGNSRRALLIVLTAATVVAVACGGTDGDGTDTGSFASPEPTVNAGVRAVLTPIGDASDFEVITPHDGVFNLERLEGRPLLLNFWFPSCPPCRAELPDLQSAFEAHGDEIQFLGVQLLGLDSAEDAAEFLEELGVSYPSGPDANSRMVRNFKIVGFPTTVFIDSEHNIVKKHTGILSKDDIESLISATVASGRQPVSTGS